AQCRPGAPTRWSERQKKPGAGEPAPVVDPQSDEGGRRIAGETSRSESSDALRQRQQRLALKHAQLMRARRLDQAGVLEVCEGSADRFGPETEVIADVAPRHQQGDGVAIPIVAPRRDP